MRVPRRFREGVEAYDVLKDPQNAAYDRMGHAAFDQSSGGFGGGGFGGGGFSDIFDQMFSEFAGGAGARQRDNSGNDLRYDMAVTLEEAFCRVAKGYFDTVPSSCDSCSRGSGAAGG